MQVCRRGLADSSQSAGCTKMSMQTVEIEPADEIVAVDIFISHLGIHGLKLHVMRRGSVVVRAVGVTACLDGSMAMTTMRGKSLIRGILCEFDAIKAVSVRLLESNGRINIKHSASIDPNFTPRLWNPYPPRPSGGGLRLAVEECPDPEDECSIHFNMDFGGSQGQKLQSLRRFTAYINTLKGFHGFCFEYENGEQVFYGTRFTIDLITRLRHCLEPSLAIDGKNGEYIDRFIVRHVYHPLRERLLVGSIEVITSKGRSKVFGNSETPFLSTQKQNILASLDASLDGAPTTVVASYNSPYDAMEDFRVYATVDPSMIGCSSEDCDSTLTFHSIEVTEPQMQDSFWMTRRGACFDAASLEGIRRVRVSAGLAGRSRLSEHVSGLWIEYHHGPPVILGQWIRDIGGFDLMTTERLVKISVWSSQEAASMSESERYGKTVGLEFASSSGQKFRFYPGALRDDILEMHYEISPYEELASMVWFFVEQYDDIQVRHRSQQPDAGPGLILYDTPRAFHPTDLSDGFSRAYRLFGGIKENPGEPSEQERSLRRLELRETFFWKDQTYNGTWVDLLTIRLCFNPKALVGVEFVYEQGITRKLGSMEGSLHELNISGDEVTLLVVNTRAENLVGIDLYTNKGKVCRASCANAVSSESCHAFDLVESASSVFLEQQDDRSVSRYKVPTDDGVGPCVGLWCMAMQDSGQIRLETVGPMFLGSN
ncbi:hypothetical protein B0I35DRAFT_510591 [Stachybotrys elegans]|uniref:Uncharacterized protein n=1 Tax=Stachybotrys elegans TaxID=80388 RepID=A0A8K0SU48_9HYPO|nr:hypothetical protein B0I35DRAFT_510591 [Stachybotrys elegans]